MKCSILQCYTWIYYNNLYGLAIFMQLLSIILIIYKYYKYLGIGTRRQLRDRIGKRNKWIINTVGSLNIDRGILLQYRIVLDAQIVSITRYMCVSQIFCQLFKNTRVVKSRKICLQKIVNWSLGLVFTLIETCTGEEGSFYI